MIGLLLSYTHLLGHKGYLRMLSDLESYTFQFKKKVVKNFVQACYACFLSFKGTKKNKLGVYPTPTRAFQEVQMDLCENLNSVGGGYSHLLICQCIFSDYILIYPLKTKTATEVSKIVLYNLIQSFPVEKIHSDNGPAFRSGNFLQLLAALGIQVIGSAALHPAGRGKIERSVGVVKLMLKKMLATKQTLNWEIYPLLISKILNTQVSPKTGFKPSELVFGPDNSERGFLQLEKTTPPHYSVKNHLAHIETLREDLTVITNVAREKLIQMKIITTEKLNKHRVKKTFKINDFVFIVDRTFIPGNPRILKTKLNPSPYIVVKPLFTTTLVKRVADGFTALYSNNDIKKYELHSPHFSELPAEVTKVLLHTFDQLINVDFSTLTRHDPLELPTSLPLFEIEGETDKDDQILDTESWENYYPLNPNIQDEFSPEMDIIIGEDEDLTKDLQMLNNEINDDTDSEEEENSPRYALRKKVTFK